MSVALPENSTDEINLPGEVARALNGQLANRTVIAWSEYDLDEQNRYAQRFAVLTADELLLIEPAIRVMSIGDIREAKVVEGLGMDRIVLQTSGGVLALRYSRRFRRDMVRLNRHLARLLPGETKDERPDWLDKVERKAELQERCARCGEFIPSYADQVCPRCAQSKAILWRLMDVAKPYRKSILVALGLTLLHAGIVSCEPLVRKYLIDRSIVLPQGVTMTTSQRIHELIYWASVTVLVIFASKIVGGFRMGMLSNIGTRVTADLRHQVYAHLHSLSLRFFNKRRTGSLITRVTADTDRIWDFIAFGSINLVRDIAMIGVMTLIMFWQNWLLALIALSPLPLIAAATWWRGKKMHTLFGRMWGYWSRVSAVVGDSLGGVKVVKAFAGERREVVRFDKRNDAFTEKELEVNIIW